MANYITTRLNEQLNNEMNKEMMKWKDETLEGLCNSVKHPKWTSALTYDEMNIHVKKGE